MEASLTVTTNNKQESSQDWHAKHLHELAKNDDTNNRSSASGSWQAADAKSALT